MNKIKSTKRALIMSAAAVLMSISMLIGTTFAWFTDTASTAVNKIQAGNLEIELQMKDNNGNWVNAEGKTLPFLVEGKIPAKGTQILWEPGCTYYVPEVRVVNKGNLAVKIEYLPEALGVTGKLAEVLEPVFKTPVDANGEEVNIEPEILKPDEASPAWSFGYHMLETAGNEYQNATATGMCLTVVATQATYENDSNGNTYDENADYTIHVNKDNIQDYLDGKYGSINGMTLVLAAGNYDKLELGRATKYPGSYTDYYIGSISEANKKTYDEFVAIKNNGRWSDSANYVRNMSNVTIKAAPGATVTVAGLTGGSGHVYGESYDYVLDKAYTSGSAYYLTQNWSNITIEGITFTAPVNISSSLGTTVIDGVAFKNCAFNINNTASGNQALRYYNENDNGKVKNLTVDGCSFNTCYQGVYTQKINGVTVINSSFNTTAHNAIAVQSGSEPVNHKAVVITGNTFANIGDRIIRFGDVGADTQITIKNNTATGSGDDSGQVMKAQFLAAGVTYDISGNNWGEGKTVANTELKDRS